MTASEYGRFDAILMDIVMVYSRGTDVCKHLIDLGCRVPLFAMTANHDAWNLPSYREAGFYGILPKPYSQKELSKKLTRLKRSGVLRAVQAEEQRWSGTSALESEKAKRGIPTGMPEQGVSRTASSGWSKGVV